MPTPQQGDKVGGVAVGNVVVTGGSEQGEEGVVRMEEVKRVENHLWLWVGLFGTICSFLIPSCFYKRSCSSCESRDLFE